MCPHVQHSLGKVGSILQQLQLENPGGGKKEPGHGEDSVKGLGQCFRHFIIASK